MLVQRLLDAVRAAADQAGIGALLVEQHVHQLARIADRIYVMRRGSIISSGRSEDVVGSLSDIEEAYLASDTDIVLKRPLGL